MSDEFIDEMVQAVLNVSFAMEQCMDDKDFLLELLNEMLDESESKMEEIEKAITDDDHVVSVCRISLFT